MKTGIWIIAGEVLTGEYLDSLLGDCITIGQPITYDWEDIERSMKAEAAALEKNLPAWTRRIGPRLTWFNSFFFHFALWRPDRIQFRELNREHRWTAWRIPATTIRYKRPPARAPPHDHQAASTPAPA